MRTAPPSGLQRAPLLAVLALIAIALAGCTAPPPVVRPAAKVLVSSRAGRIVDWTVRSPSVPGEQPVRILLPSDYDRHPHERFPVLYLLHGCCDTFASWTRSTDIVQFTDHVGVIVVMPDGGPVGFYSDWLHGPRWERYHTDELPRLLASRLRVDGRAAVAGLSMGGHGALAYAARHPGEYVAAASFSGLVDSSLSDYEPTVYLNLLLDQGMNHPNDLWGDPSTRPSVWRAHDPTALAARLRGIALFVSCGDGRSGPYDTATADDDRDGTEANLLDENRGLVARLHALRIPVETELGYHGTHTWPYWQRELHHAWPMLAAALRVRSVPGPTQKS